MVLRSEIHRQRRCCYKSVSAMSIYLIIYNERVSLCSEVASCGTVTPSAVDAPALNRTSLCAYLWSLAPACRYMSLSLTWLVEWCCRYMWSPSLWSLFWNCSSPSGLTAAEICGTGCWVTAIGGVTRVLVYLEGVGVGLGWLFRRLVGVIDSRSVRIRLL